MGTCIHGAQEDCKNCQTHCVHDDVVIEEGFSTGENLLGKIVTRYMETVMCLKCKETAKRFPRKIV